MENKKYPERSLMHTITVPFIWGIVAPLLILDFFMEFYHRICFPIYNIPLVERSKYIKIDRHKLEYLDPLEKINCVYCGYANGLLRYTSEIAAQTEKYWCGIKHAKTENFIEPEHHKEFVEYGNQEEFIEKYQSDQLFEKNDRR
ncbi:hypothetical protein KJ733_01645 [Patescibacteria group bacterium]|nr:hypothetical protein [Patescibacteria group bacterium]MBU1951596.1 hypothetical protein [Patescibacteria group bacterium]